MTGKIITGQQIRIYMNSKKNGKTKKVAAAQAGFSDRSSRNVEQRLYMVAKTPHDWRTRKNPFEAVWQNEVLPLLEKNPGLQAKTILEELQRRYPGEYASSCLRTLQRRVQKWKATSGPEKEVIFRQNHPMGWQGMSDFTNASTLNVTIEGEHLEHLLYHYRLVYSTWEYVSVVLGGESFPALAEGLQNALWLSCGAPETHRTDSLSAAYKNCSDKAKEAFTKSYAELCMHYQMEPTRNNKGVSHENGSIETSHGDLKNRLAQALMLRGSSNFSSLEEYKQFIREIVSQHNRRIHKRYLEELPYLKDLPERKTTDFKEERLKVTTSSTICLYSCIYSVPSQLIGMILKVHVYDDRLACFVGSDLVVQIERKRRYHGTTHHINYRHIIGSLIRKPQAFRNYIYKEELFPTLAFRETWERLSRELDSRTACREYVKILKEAAESDREPIVNSFLESKLQENILPRAIDVQKLFRSDLEAFPELVATYDSLKSYDALLNARGAQ